MTAHDPMHVLEYAEQGTGKSTAAGTFPMPQLIFFFDPMSKERPYLYQPDGTPKGVITKVPGPTPLDLVTSKDDGSLLVQLEHYIDRDPTSPEAYARFLARLSTLEADIAALGIKTVCCDSVTFMELAARKEQQYRLNPSAKDPRQWFGGATDTLEEILMLRFGSLACNVVLVAHTDRDKDEVHGFMVSNPSAPGRLRYRLASAYSEVYRAYVVAAGDARVYLWQTRSDALYNAASQVGAPNPCMQGYPYIWGGR